MTVPTYIFVVFFVLFALVLLVISLGQKLIETERKKKVTGALRTSERLEEAPETSILTDAETSGRGAKTSFLTELPLFKRLDAKIRQAGLEWSVGRLLAMMAIAAIVGALLGTRVTVPFYREFAMAALACSLGLLPYLYVRVKRSKRMAAFEEQFPDALDFLARSMRAGHAFSVSLEMMAEESPDPTGVEFRKLFHEQNLGAPIEVAMQNLAKRVPLLDVRFFVSAVLLQKETGGNLAEILTKLAYVIRERFRLKGQVRAASAHGRITATVLSVMPIITMLGLMIVAPNYLKVLAEDPDGKWLIMGAIAAMLVGFYWMKRIIDIKV